jgi:hypothetical protein
MQGATEGSGRLANTHAKSFLFEQQRNEKFLLFLLLSKNIPRRQKYRRERDASHHTAFVCVPVADRDFRTVCRLLRRCRSHSGSAVSCIEQHMLRPRAAPNSLFNVPTTMTASGTRRSLLAEVAKLRAPSNFLRDPRLCTRRKLW